MEDLRGKACLVTGASTGIGAAVARALGGQGASVAVHYHRSADEARRVADDVRAGGGQAVVLQGDVGDPGIAGRLVADTVAAFGRLDVLINNAGGPLRRVDFVETPDELYDELMDLNFRSVFATCRAAAADECVGAFLFLASERLSSYVTGQVLEVNGGQFMP
jgi:3-oxoacyl-[acyl-carrier protein] reductase